MIKFLLGITIRKAFPLFLTIFLITVLVVAGLWVGPFLSPNTVVPVRGGQSLQYSNWVEFISTTWDSAHYLNIAQNGYSGSLFAFFPLFPTEIRLIRLLFFNLISWNLAMIFAGFINFLLLGIVLHKFISVFTQRYNLNINPGKVLTTALLLPFAFFWVLPYTESLFLSLLVIGLYVLFFGKKLTTLALLVPVSFLLSLTRSAGLFFVIAPAVVVLNDFFVSGGFKLKNVFQKIKTEKFRFLILLLAMSASVAGLLSFMLYGYYKTGDFWISKQVQAEWGRGSTLMVWEPLINAFRALKDQFFQMLDGNPVSYYWFFYDMYVVSGIFLFFISLATSLLFYKKTKSMEVLVFVIISIISFVLPLTSNSFESLHRYIATTPVYFLLLPVVLNKVLPEEAIGFMNFIYFFVWIVLSTLYSGHYWVG